MDNCSWFACEGPWAAFDFIRGRLSPRQMRLFLVAVARRVWDQLPSGEYRDAIEIVEQVADGRLPTDRISELSARYWELVCRGLPVMAARSTDDHARELLAGITDETRRLLLHHQPTEAAQWLAVRGADNTAGRTSEAKAQVTLLRDVFGNPFDPVLPNPEWFTSTAVLLARGIYESRAFDRLPILADALQDAGCEDTRVLGHCREPGEHIRGCWVVDMVLGHERPLTADEWDTTTDLGWMTRTAWPRTTDRKIGLVACGCARQEGDPMRNDIWGTYVLLAERHLDGQLPGDEEWPYVEENDAGITDEGTRLYALSYIRVDHPTNVLTNAAEVLGEYCYAPDDDHGPVVAKERRTAPARLMRCVLGNPLRPPVAFPRRWKPAKIVKFAREIYDTHAFDHMPELATLLERAGCADASILAHCREKGPYPDGLPEGYPVPPPPTHCRGCWVIDGILGKE